MVSFAVVIMFPIQVLSGHDDTSKGVQTHILWQIGKVDNSDSEFALAPNNNADFLQHFGSSEKIYYIGLSKPGTSWPYVLPGIRDRWAGSHYNLHEHNAWNEMNTLTAGFVIRRFSNSGACTLTINFCDASPKYPPHILIKINGTKYERALLPGGSDSSLYGDLTSAKPQKIQVKFPCSLLKEEFNKISLRTTKGSWCIFDALSLETPDAIKLTSTSNIVIQKVIEAPYSVSSNKETPATLRVKAFCKNHSGNLNIKIGNGKVTKIKLNHGLQVLEIPGSASPEGKKSDIKFTVNGKLLYKTKLNLTSSPPVIPSDYVNTFMGTEHSRWLIAPGPWMPFSMVKISPDNQQQQWCAGYEYTHDYINCFSHIHEFTMAGLGMMPTIGSLRTHPGFNGKGYSSHIDKSSERGGIGYYSVLLKDSNIKVELTATTRTSLQRYTFPASQKALVLFPFLLPNEYPMHILSANVRRVGNNEIEGEIKTSIGPMYGCKQNFILHFVSQFNCNFETMGGWENLAGAKVTIPRGYTYPPEEMGNNWHGAKIMRDVQQLNLSGDCGAFVKFKTSDKEKIEVRTGISLVSTADALQNLKVELSKPFGWNFKEVVQNQRKVWDYIFNSVNIETPNAREKTRFYTNLYRALSGRNTWSDINGNWIDPYGRMEKLNNPRNVMLGSDALWNTFWNMNQVMNLIAPQWSVNWAKSELELYKKCGWLAKGPAGLKYISVMVAEHEIPLMVAAYQAGLKGLDGKEILAAVLKMQDSLSRATPNGGHVGNKNLAGYLKYHYVPDNGSLKGRTSNTEECAYDDWCVSQLAKALGRKKIAERFLKRSEYWRNVFDAKTGYARPRKSNGDWVTPFNPYHMPGFTEGSPWQYTWFVPQNIPGLVKAMGRQRFINRLNEGFEKSAKTRFNAATGHAADCPVDQGNQPTMDVSWLFNWAGAPWLTQKWTRAILEEYYGYTPATAYLGDEDQGQMSSWFVMTSMGLFQVQGGCRVNPVYEISAPLYSRVVIHLSKKYYNGNTFTIIAHNASPSNCYIQSATLNGKPLNRWWITQQEVIKGGRLVLELGAKPNKSWAKNCSFPN